MKEEDFNLSIGNEPEADLDLEFGYVLDDDHLDEQPVEGTPLHSVMMANGILTLEDRERYYHYSPDNRGCCMEKPIIIEEKEDYVRTIVQTNLERDPKNINKITISFLGTGFLRYMVRNMIGMLIEIGEGKHKSEDIIKIMEAEDRTKAGICAPACGLYLKDVFY